MNVILDRIQEIIEKKGIPESHIYKQAGIKQSTWYSWKQNDRTPGLQHLVDIAKCLGVSVAYLATGEVDSVEDCHFENEHGMLQGKPTKIKVLGKVAAGTPIEMIEDVIGEETISADLAKTGNYFALRISGRSMEPRMFHGDVVIVRQQADVESGQVAIVAVNGEEATCKKVEKHGNGVMLVPLNGEYEERFISKDDSGALPIQILGRVVEVRGRL